MIKDKVFIFAPYSYSINNGGYSGFIAHNLIDKPRDNFLISGDVLDFNKKNFIKKIIHSIGKRIYTLQGKRRSDFAENYYFKKVKAKNYKFLFFHEVYSLYQCRNLISDDQVVILQSHAPELPSEEYLKIYEAPSEEILNNYEIVKAAEKYSFQRANIVVLPTPGCVDIYAKLLNPISKIKFILSGAKSKNGYKNLEKKEEINHIVDQDKINLMYIGRRNSIKGFDIVLDSFRKVRKIRKDINLILVGSGDKIYEEGIIDIGFSSNPIFWYNSVDYLINANRQSYFDLSIIEALSTGVPIIMSNNFGHHYYENKSPLIHTFDVTEKDSLFNILNGNLNKRDMTNRSNIELYQEQLTDSCYFQRFNEFCLELINKE